MFKAIFLFPIISLCIFTVHQYIKTDRSAKRPIYDQFTPLNSSHGLPQNSFFGLSSEDKREIIYAVNQLKIKIMKDSDALPSQFIKNQLSNVNWDENLAIIAYAEAEKCSPASHTSLSEGIMVSKAYERNPSLSEVVNEWYIEIKSYSNSKADPDVDNFSDHSDQDLKTQIKEAIGCARSRCFMDKLSATLLVCSWKVGDDAHH